MRIGTDISLQTCREQGYLMMDFKKRELFTGGKINEDCFVQFLAHTPDYILRKMYGTENPVGEKRIMLDVYHSVESLWELYTENKEGIDGCSGMSHDKPTCEHLMLNLACDINSYCGLE